MNTKLLDGLEMFLGVGVMFSNSSKLQMTGETHIYRPPLNRAIGSHYPTFLLNVG